MLARLDAVLGEGSALRARVVDGPRIERRYVLEPFTLEPLASCGPRAEPAALPAAATLQLRIVEPYAIDVRVIDGAPRFVGSPPQQVVELAGPWRVEEAWWARATGEGAPLVRDEYDVCLDDGALLRLAREGPSTSSGQARWSVRGVYD